jgi:hypothetical protein
MAQRIPRDESLSRVHGVGALFAAAYGNVGSSIYYALGVTAAFALGLTPIAFVISGLIFAATAATYAEATVMFPEAAAPRALLGMPSMSWSASSPPGGRRSTTRCLLGSSISPASGTWRVAQPTRRAQQTGSRAPSAKLNSLRRAASSIVDTAAGSPAAAAKHSDAERLCLHYDSCSSESR